MNRLKTQAGLIDYLNVLWKRKWLIILPTVCLVIVVVIISLLMPPVWEVEMIVQPAKFFSQTPGGQFIDVLITDPRQMATEINQKSYDFSIAEKLKLDIRKFPKLKAEYLKDTKLVRIAVNEKDVEKAKAILQSLFLLLKDNLDKRIFIEIDNINTEIKKNELQIDLLTNEIIILQNKLNILEQREREILVEMKAAKERISRIEMEQLDAMKGGGKEALGQLLYSNEIQKNFQYINTLNELISDKKIEREDLAQKRKENEQTIEGLRNSDNNLKERKGKFDYTQMIKAATPSIFPVSPKKMLNVLLAGILGLMIFSLVALFLEYLDKAKVEGT